MTPNALNFSGGPGALPPIVLNQTRDAIAALPETGLSVLGMSHRSDWFRAILDEAERNIRQLLGLSDRYAVTFVQGGSSLLFATIPMNFATDAYAPPEYVNSGYWSSRATAEAGRVRACRIAWDGQRGGYRELPALDRLDVAADAAYLHYVTNETVEGLQFAEPSRAPSVPLIADMSSDFLSKPLAADRFAMIYAHAQKNLGPAGVTVALIDREMLARIPGDLPHILDLRTQIAHRSNYNTPPVFAIYVLTLVTRWLRDDIGGLAAMQRINETKAQRLYGTLDALRDAVAVHAALPWRSRMNAAFTFGDERLDRAFVDAAGERGIVGLEGHRSLGGLRASLYNAVTPEAVETLCETLTEFSVQRV
ncbi:3-phosphoserine/phosphohydroxythreonine transaminase [Paraburkholderia caballeronis]|uniref:Phosphoserine aminotransferase n=1 Tax=Paraburkholderia caballeronis TaxID=416943 RepID=A0A1H7TIH1_9BURK|nr:3-phosphoserine/phosphohydroxythreonine transaminase [Paraburkholderia caballeronis]PXW18402.1 phosphoserine aminotransferase [Paraburkholderia caballeronis]PXW95682.1 phosphoserine aminotransferase [Paraburkholderia caballeronis]RAJ92028.1 phosphoserine aminotransferase [Paraburkholderia caballeronis]SEB77705.1 phosphoserine aminotransferase apoenzyme [Paraburkholderia caballeronis]SEL84591.1 phosphoserine aminotransferase apoenzyme [Paraburkholderia caballeronis]